MINQKGFIPIAVILLIVIAGVAVSSGVFYYVGKNSGIKEASPIAGTPVPTTDDSAASQTPEPQTPTPQTSPPEDRVISPAPAPTAIKSSQNIIDTHAHILPRDEKINSEFIDKLVAAAKKAGVSKIALGLHARGVPERPPTYSSQHDDWTLKAYAKYPDMIIPMLAGFDPEDNAAPQYVEDQLKKGVFKGIGELDLRNSPKETKTPADHPNMIKIYQTAAKYRVPVMIHYDFCYQTACESGKNELKNAMRQNPGTKFIFAHTCPLDLMKEFTNLYCEFELVGQQIPNGFRDRIVLGTDVQNPRVTAPKGNRTDIPYEEAIAELFKKLSAFSKEDADKIAYKTAESLFGFTAPVKSPTPPPSPSSSPSQTKKFEVISVTKDAGSRVSGGSVPFIMKLADGRLRLYYCAQGGINSAVSTDGLSFTQESGVRIGPDFSSEFEKVVCDPSLVKLSDGKARMYYKGANSGQGGPGQAVHKIFSAISSDGLIFQKEGLRVDSETSGDNGWASVPDAIMLPDGRVRLYFGSGGGIMTMTAADGLNFGERKALNLKSVVDPAIVMLPDGTYLLLTAVIGEQFAPYRAKGLYLFTSKDGFNFENETQLLKESGVFDPTGILIDSKTIRIYYGHGLPPAPMETRSITVKFNY